MEVSVEDTEREISRREGTLPPKVRMREQLKTLVQNLNTSNVFEAAAGTITGLSKGTTDPKGTAQNYFRIDLQQDPKGGKELNIQYQVSGVTMACALVNPDVKDQGEAGIKGIREALVGSFGSGTYPEPGAKNSGSSQHIYSVSVVEKKEKEQVAAVGSSTTAEGPTRKEKKEKKAAEDKERLQRFLASHAQKQPPKKK